MVIEKFMKTNEVLGGSIEFTLQIKDGWPLRRPLVGPGDNLVTFLQAGSPESSL